MKTKRIHQWPLLLTFAAVVAPACDTSDDPTPACDSSELWSTGCKLGALCELATDCTSGEPKSFVFECVQNNDLSRWQLATSEDSSCDKPYEQCSREGQSETVLCHASNWVLTSAGGDGPDPCPLTQPKEGSNCNAGGTFGGDRAACGYSCADGAWTITGCQATGAVEPSGTWQSDGACGLGGAGGGS